MEGQLWAERLAAEVNAAATAELPEASAAAELRKLNAEATSELRTWSWEQQWVKENGQQLFSPRKKWEDVSPWRSGWLQKAWMRLVNGRADGSFFEPEKLGGQCYYGGTPLAISTVMGDVFTCRFLVMEVGCLSLRAWNQVEELLEKHPPEDGQGGAHLYPDSLAMPQEGDKYSGRYCSKELQVWDRSVCARLDHCDRFGNSPGHLAVQAHSDASMFAFLNSLYKDGYGKDKDAAAASTAGAAATPAASTGGSAAAPTAGCTAAPLSPGGVLLSCEPKPDHPACRIVIQCKKEALEMPDSLQRIATVLVKGVLEKASQLRSAPSVGGAGPPLVSPAISAGSTAARRRPASLTAPWETWPPGASSAISRGSTSPTTPSVRSREIPRR
jgi:hypothetical protein